MPKKKLKKYLQFAQNPTLGFYKALEDIKKTAEESAKKEIDKLKAGIGEEMRSILKEQVLGSKTFNIGLEGIERIKGDKGDKGEQGDRGEQGDSIVGPQGIRGDTGERGTDGKNGKDGLQGVKGDKGDKGKDGSPDKPQDIIKKLHGLKGDERLDASAIKNLPASTQFGGKLHRGGATYIKNELLGTGDGTTKTFTLAHQPYTADDVAPYVGTGRMFRTDDFTISNKDITFITAPPTDAKVRADYRKS